MTTEEVVTRGRVLWLVGSAVLLLLLLFYRILPCYHIVMDTQPTSNYTDKSQQHLPTVRPLGPASTYQPMGRANTNWATMTQPVGRASTDQPHPPVSQQHSVGPAREIPPWDGTNPVGLPEAGRPVSNKTGSTADLWTWRREPFTAYWVAGRGSLLADRLPLYIQAISRLRQQIQTERGYQDWADPGDSLTVLWGSRDDYLHTLGNFTQVQTVALSWLQPDPVSRHHGNWSSLTDRSNVVIQQYYTWVGTEPLCDWIRTEAYTKARWDAVYNRTCHTDLVEAVSPGSVEPVYFHGKPINPSHYWPNDGLAYPAYFYTSLPQQVLYIHIIQDAIITEPGDVISGSLKLVPYTCSHDTSPVKPAGYQGKPIYSEVFIITQFWGASFFHLNLEVLPRLAPYLAFLRENPQIKIHAAQTDGVTGRMLALLGIDSHRLVSGVARGKIVYMPQGTACGFPQIQELQILSQVYHTVIQSLQSRPSPRPVQSRPSPRPVPSRPNLVVIHRSGQRQLTDATATELGLQQLAAQYSLQFRLFHDQRLPSQEDTMRMFYDAAVIVAPHGAGLSNMVYSQPGTYVIEAVCNPPHVNMCYQWTAHILGMRYHAVPSRAGCEGVITVSTDVITAVVRTYLDQIQRARGG